jgi:hypothetical protein
VKSRSPGIHTDDRYRTVGERQIVEMLLVAAFVSELDSGQRDKAAAQVVTALNAWIDLGLGYRLADSGERLFDPVEVINRMKWAGYHDLDGFWADHFVMTSRGFLGEWDRETPRPDQPARRRPARFSLNLSRLFCLNDIERGRKLRLRVPLPLSQSSENIEIEPLVAPDLAARISRSEGRLEFQLAAPPEPAVEIGATMSFTTDGWSTDEFPAAPIEGTEIYLRQNEGHVRVTPRIQALSQNLAGDERDRLKIVKRFFHYLIDELMCGLVHYDQIDAEAPGDWVLDHGWYDCQLGSSLLVSMCRASAIPARLLSGHMMYRLAPGFHYWAEVWIDEKGWTPFDFLTWDLSKGGQDTFWRNCLAGAIDYRMVTQCFLLRFVGPMSVRFPPSWHLINAPICRGMNISFTELDGRLIYSDRVQFRAHPCEPGKAVSE